jgi:hypothetical protein
LADLYTDKECSYSEIPVNPQLITGSGGNPPKCSYGAQNVHRWEVGDSPLPGWATVIMEIVSSGTIPNLDQVKNQKQPERPEE